MEKVLSIVIPTYNMEKYLRKCLNSLIIPDKGIMEYMEVLVINDGSKDASSVIAHEYEAMSPSVFRVIDKENGNYGSCVNRGLSEATGKYIKILDADDSFNTLGLEEHIKYLLSVDEDLVLTSYITVNENDVLLETKVYTLPPLKEVSFEEVCLNKDFIDTPMHAVTYKTENLINLQYKQSEGISYTDQEWIFIPMMVVRRLTYQPVQVYRYLLGREGQTVQANVLDRSFSQQVTCAVNRIKDLKARNLDLTENQREFLFYNLGRVVAYVYRATILRGLYDIGKLKELDETIKQDNPDFYEYLDNYSVNLRLFKYKYIEYFRINSKKAPFFVMMLYMVLYKLFH